MNALNLEQAMKNPASTFGTPEAVYNSSEMTIEEKRHVLLQWKDQLQSEQVADDENMTAPTGGETVAEKLRRVTTVLQRLDG